MSRMQTGAHKVNFMRFRLDSGMIELCKQIAKRHEQKMRLDYELIRATKCAEIMQKGLPFDLVHG